MILVALTGTWINNLTMWLDNALAISFVILPNLIGYRLKRVVFCNMLAMLLILLYYLQFIARVSTLRQWHEWWQLFVVVAIAFPLNAFFFTRYRAAAKV